MEDDGEPEFCVTGFQIGSDWEATFKADGKLVENFGPVMSGNSMSSTSQATVLLMFQVLVPIRTVLHWPDCHDLMEQGLRRPQVQLGDQGGPDAAHPAGAVRHTPTTHRRRNVLNIHLLHTGLRSLPYQTFPSVVLKLLTLDTEHRPGTRMREQDTILVHSALDGGSSPHPNNLHVIGHHTYSTHSHIVRIRRTA